MSEAWKHVSLAEIAEVGAGNSAPQDKSLYADGSHPFVRTADVGGIKIGTITCSRDQLNDDGIHKLRLVKRGTILMPKSGASTFCNHRVMMGFDGYVASHLATVAIKETAADARFVFHYLTTVKAQDLIQDHKYPSLNLPVIESILVPLPPLSEQKRIVSILDKAFEAIEDAKGKAESNLGNAKELFDSYLARLDEHKKRLGDFVQIRTGKLNANAAVEGGQYPFFTCSREVFDIDVHAFDCDAVLLAGNNASGDFNVKHYVGKFNAYQRTYVITVNDKSQLLSDFLYFQLTNSLKDLKQSSVGANTRFLKLGMIQNLKICVPPINRQRDLVHSIRGIEQNTRSIESVYQQKITALNELKQSILHKAFTGQLNDKSPELELVG
tara:strand:- start:943 stop:2091 length:1149 start_codon:yes stop_codon:yes gene_type:complete